MGLSGRKTKQRIPNDPRNLAWANDANKFGAAYLAKLGWDPSRGLGVSGEGRTKALSVTQKLDMLGIGADHRNSAEGMAWKQNKDFENLLKRLNAANGDGDAEDEEPMKLDGFVRAAPAPALGEEKQAPREDVVDGGEKKSKKKRKKGTDEVQDEERKKKRKKSKSRDDQSDSEEVSKKEKRKKNKCETAEEIATAAQQTEIVVPTPVPAPTATIASRHPRAAFRGRHMAAKSLASKSASAIAEILGVSPAPSTSVSGYPSSTPTPYPSTPFEPGPSTSSSSGSTTPAEEMKLQELSVSSKSVMDYFKEKLAAKSNARVFGSSRGSPTAQDDEPDDYDERPRMGLGASRLRTEVVRAAETDMVEVEERRGLGGIGSGMRSSFAAMFTSTTVTRTITADVEQPAPVEAEAVRSDAEDPKKSRKEKERKKEKKTKKEKGKEKAKDEDAIVATASVDNQVDANAERKRRKEEKRRRKEAEAQAEAGAVGGAVSEAEVKEHKRKKDKNRGKAES